MKKILLIVNTNYHTEVALAFYGILKLNNYNPYLFLIVNKEMPDRYNLKDLLIKYNINFIEEYNQSLKNEFEKAILITPIKGDREARYHDIDSIPNYFHKIIQDFKSKMVLVIHKPSYLKYYKEIISQFNNCKLIGLSPMASKFGLNYLFPMDNPINQNNLDYNKIQNKVKLLLMGRFIYSNRDLKTMALLDRINLNCKRDYQITIMGESAKDFQSFFKKNPNIVIKQDLSEIEFYNEIKESHFILNFLSRQDPTINYHEDVITSNYNHIFSFRKPQICFYPYNLLCPVPSLIYLNDNVFAISERIEEAVNMKDIEYKNMVDNFNMPVSNIRNHNSRVLQELL